MGNRLRHNKKEIHNIISEKILSRGLRNLNVDEQKYMLNNEHKIDKKYDKKEKFTKIHEKNNIYLNIYKKYSSKYKIKRENISNQNFLRIEKKKFFIIEILLSYFCIINSLINSKNEKICDDIIFYSYEITLKVKGIGNKNILSVSSNNIIPCPTYVYQNEVNKDITDCHYIDITEENSEIRLEWTNIDFYTTKGMFDNCKDITEIDMTKFDTSLVTDMSEMFSMCSSLESLNVSNLNTEKVETFESMFSNCTNLISINLESFTNPSAISLSRMFYGCINLEYINIKNFEEKENIILDEMFFNIPKNAIVCLLSCPSPTNFTIGSMNETQATISWEGYELSKFIISYGLQTLSNPEEGVNWKRKLYFYKFRP